MLRRQITIIKVGRTATATIITMITMGMIMTESRPLLRSSPRRRGPSRLDSRLRGNERGQFDTASLTQDALYRLLIWLSPAYPVGAFAYSSGIEWAVEAGDINNVATLRDWITDILTLGSGFNDGVLFAQMHRATAAGDDGAAIEIAELAAALVASRERYEETTKLGRAFIEVTGAAWPCQALVRLKEIWPGAVAYPVAVGTACAGHDVPLVPALHAFLTAIVANWISAGVRLIPLGHTDSQRLLQVLEPVVGETAQRAMTSSLGDLGSATFRADLAGIKHETQYTRLFRS
jgi:urease accessory protein